MENNMEIKKEPTEMDSINKSYYVVYISNNSYSTKAECVLSHKNRHKYTLCKVSYDKIREVIISSYLAGHIFNICDFDASPVYILDCDNLTDSQYNLIFSKAWQDQMIKNYNLSAIDVLPSASKSPSKAKIFCWFEHSREFSKNSNNQWTNIDCSHEKFLNQFYNDTQIEVDSRMNIYNQLTYGSKLDNKTFDFSTVSIISNNCNQPKQLNNTCYNQHNIGIPVNPIEYNTLYGKLPRYNFPRFEWNTIHYSPDTPQHYKVTRISIGKRHSTILKVVSIVVFNAVLNNQVNNTNFTIKSCDKKIKDIIFENFESPNTFYSEESSYIQSLTYKLWNDYNNSDIYQLYKNICSALKIKERYSYTPRDYSIKNLYYKPIYQDLFNAKSMDERLIIINSISPSVDITNTLIQYCYKDKSLPKVSRKSRISIYQYILDKVKQTGKNIYYYTEKSIKEMIFCCKHKIKYLKQQLKNNHHFLISTNNISNNPLDIIIGRKLEIDNENIKDYSLNC